MSERDYNRGSRMAWTMMLQQCLTHLGYKSDEGSKAAWIIEREAAVNALRDICRDHGDNDWPDDLRLDDIIEKHLGRHIIQATANKFLRIDRDAKQPSDVGPIHVEYHGPKEMPPAEQDDGD